jgi:hypothetical protein
MADVNELMIRRDASKIDSVVSDGSNLSGRSFGAFRGSADFSTEGRLFALTMMSELTILRKVDIEK